MKRDNAKSTHERSAGHGGAGTDPGTSVLWSGWPLPQARTPPAAEDEGEVLRVRHGDLPRHFPCPAWNW